MNSRLFNSHRVVAGCVTECGIVVTNEEFDMSEHALDELGYYLLAGAGGEGPATLMDEARRGEELGFGTAFISERWNVKERRRWSARHAR